MKRISNQFMQWVVISVFVFSMVFAIYLGADFYQSMSAEASISLNQRTILLYFNHRFNQSDAINDLIIYDDMILINHEGYFTLIYAENGYLVEQVSEVNYKLEETGQIIASLSDLTYSVSDEQIKVEYLDENKESHELIYTLKSLRVAR